MQPTDDSTRMGAKALGRYSAIFGAIVAPASGVGLGFPAIVVATWVIARLIARRYRRQITARETLHLALVSWVWIFVAWLIQSMETLTAPGFFAFLLVWQGVGFVTVWGAYVWLARFVIRRTLRLQPPIREAESASAMLAQQEEEYAEATARTATLAVAWLSVGFAGVLGVVLLSALVAVMLALLGLDVGGGAWVFGSLLVGMPALLAGWAYFIGRKSAEVFPSHRLILWLRRFHRADLMEFPFPYFLERACRGIAVPITLQDSTVTDARTAAQLRPAFHVERAAEMASWFVLVFSGFELSRRESSLELESVALGAVAVLSLIVMFALRVYLKRLGVVDLGTKRGQRLIRLLLEAIDSDKGVPQTLTIVSTPDEAWQSWVLEFIKRADAVLIDVTHLSSNLHWELRAIAQHLEAKQLILAWGEPEGRHEGIPRDTRVELTRLLGDPMFEQSHRFFYQLPRDRGWTALRRIAPTRMGWVRLSRASMRPYLEQMLKVAQGAFAASDQAQPS